MSHLVKREEILDFVTYDEQREQIRGNVLKIKEPRRIHLGEYFTFLFENKETIRYQILEMVRAERIVKETDIQHEINTYNELLGGKGVLGCTLLIEISSEEERDLKLKEWMGVPDSLYLLGKNGEKVFAIFDQRQVGEKRLSSVQYLKFDTKGEVPVTIGVDHPAVRLETSLNSLQQQALLEDLKSSASL